MTWQCWHHSYMTCKMYGHHLVLSCMVVTTASHIRAGLAEPFIRQFAYSDNTNYCNESNVIYFLFTVITCILRSPHMPPPPSAHCRTHTATTLAHTPPAHCMHPTRSHRTRTRTCTLAPALTLTHLHLHATATARTPPPQHLHALVTPAHTLHARTGTSTLARLHAAAQSCTHTASHSSCVPTPPPEAAPRHSHLHTARSDLYPAARAVPGRSGPNIRRGQRRGPAWGSEATG